MTLLVLLVCWLAALPVTGLCLGWWLSRHSPGNGVGRHVEAEVRERVGA